MVFRRFTAGSLTLLVLVTWRLWFGATDFPRVGIVDAAVPELVHWLLTTVAVVAAWMDRRWSWMITAVALATLFVLDQTTQQPWAYLISIHAALFALRPPIAGVSATTPQQKAHQNSQGSISGVSIGDGLNLNRAVAISVYLYSGLGKLDTQFVQTIGQQFLSALTLGVANDWPPKAALLLPLTEVLAGVLLIATSTRRLGATIVIAIHAGLIAILGPWSLDHSNAVLVWNAVLIGQTMLLFWNPSQRPVIHPMDHSPTSDPPKVERSLANSWTFPLAWLLASIVILGPMLERWGYWNHWLAWALYAPHTSRVELEIAASASIESSLLARFIEDDSDGDGWHRVNLSAMSLESVHVPLYPQSSYQLRLSRHLILQHNLDRDVRLIERGPADRWTGERTERYRNGRREIMADAR